MIQLPSSTTLGTLLTCFSFSPKRRETCKKACTRTITITISIILRTWFFTSTCSPTIGPALVIHSHDSQTSSSASRAIYVRESSTKTSPKTRHWGTINWAEHTSTPIPSKSQGPQSPIRNIGTGHLKINPV